MKRIFPFFRKMSFILFLSFLLYSVVFVLLISVINNTNWQSLFSRFHSVQMEKNGYLVMDDMRREGITHGPLSEEQKQWLQRRAALYGILLRYESKDRKEIWFDTFSKAQVSSSQDSAEVPYTTNGQMQGYIKMQYILSNSELEPAYAEFMKSIQFRSKLLLIGVVAASILFSFFIARSLSKPLKEVYRMATEIGKGKRDVAVPLKGPEEVRRLAATLHEMTKELKKQEDWRHHLMEDLTHELRTPLTTLLTQIEAIIDGVYEPEPERLQDIYEELIRLSRLVNDLERLSEAESARFSLHVRRTNMVELARAVYSNFLPLARSKGIKLTFEPAFVPCYAEVDRDKIVQVLSNIVSNAIKYTPEGGNVTISVSYNIEWTVIRCEDNGIGVSDKDLPYIFNRLYRADKSRSRFSGGVGLGLSIAKALAEAHNGTIEAESELGVGSVFTITLPIQFKPYMGEES
ncbi:HAMP domain-containing histidine kinase [Paenibacillus mesophilus]|uniref:sensor histidine kinase n=1 Tax=Paenibacillus mesophilus TaxID=2582849 RepID=UPI00110E329F|nr:HAMP domain-containing sensor histidine kinase [Paenibacillus mesophilus]TMV48488.1 HAMP domain-containing histidine kinase [Paenibacillus mesophilus]